MMSSLRASELHCRGGARPARGHAQQLLRPIFEGKQLMRGMLAKPSSPTVQLSATGGSQAPKAQVPKAQTPKTEAPKAASRPTPPKPAVDYMAAVIEAEKTGATLEVKIKAINKGGLIAAYGDLKGFLPYNQLGGSTRMEQTNDFSYLVGQTLKTKVVSVDTTNGRKEFVVSEKKLLQSEAMKNLKLGKVVKAVVSSVEEYGAFVDLVDVPYVSGLVHKTELSWDSFTSVDTVVSKGQVLMVKIIDLDVAKCRLGLSAKQTLPDPIKMTLDKVEWQATKSMPADMQLLMERLKKMEGVEDVRIGRQAVEPKIASQELVVYLTKEVSEDGFDVVARLGSVLQELRVVTKMSRDDGRALLARAVQN